MTHTITAGNVAADLQSEQMLARMRANLSDDWAAHLEGQGKLR
jgi:hypothetical protein